MPAFVNDPVAVTQAARPARGKRQKHLFGGVNIRINLNRFGVFLARFGEQPETMNRMRPAAVTFVTEKLLPGFSSNGGKTQGQQTQYQNFDFKCGEGILPLSPSVGKMPTGRKAGTASPQIDN